jgi:CHAD domain-containing protein
MKARKVKGLDPEGPLADNVARIIHVRCDELHSFFPAALDSEEVEALHDLRIAAKRLRYILELHHPSFGPYAETAAKRAKELQDVIGEIHDCDVTIPRVEELMDRCRAEDVLAILDRARDKKDVDPKHARATPHAADHRGLEAMRSYLAARRAHLYERFLELWLDLQREGFRARLEFALEERPGTFTPLSPAAGA